MSRPVELSPDVRAAAADFVDALVPVQIADTEAERDAIHRFRYTVYVDELRRKLGSDDEPHSLHDEQDDWSEATLLYTEEDGAITGTIRVLRWAPAEVPASYRETFSMQLFPGIEGLTIGQVARFAIQPNHRGQLGLLSLMCAQYQLYAAELQTDLAFVHCAPGLVRHYRLLGCRTYAAPLVQSDEGIHVPLVFCPSDSEYLVRVGSPLAPIVAAFYGPRKRAPLDLGPFADVLDADSSPVQVDADAVWDAVSRMRAEGGAQPTLLDALDEEVARTLSEKGFVINLAAGQVLTEKGLAEQEMFVILDGAFEVHDGDRRFSVLGRGDVIGELAFFGSSGQRTATVTAASEGRVLVLRRRFINELRSSDPAGAADILFELARVLADRRYIF